ncbi:hypothetical protein GWK47_039608 [Chionoecetes opilio]|uniref:Uncharacterized protein n=1 Tax=Chionoecetes opilio TaxID=41210 RepID=A0A8J4YL76_CHIOP|nr:hypothetical protein GWK47_039608 [Chionoecetes opilio]
MNDDPLMFTINLAFSSNSTTSKLIRRWVTTNVRDMQDDRQNIVSNLVKSDSSRRKTYVELNPSLNIHNVYNTQYSVNELHRIAFTRFRVSSHNLACETGWNRRGRGRLPLQESVCTCGLAQTEMSATEGISAASLLVEAGREVALSASAVVESGSVVVVKEAEVKASVVEGERRVECSEGCGVALKFVLEAIDDLKRYFVSEVNDLKSVVRKQEIEIRSLKCEGGVSGGAHARDVPGGVPEGDVPRATTKGVVSSKSPRNGEWQLSMVEYAQRRKR